MWQTSYEGKQDMDIYDETLDQWQASPPTSTATQRRHDHVTDDPDPIDDIGVSSHALFILKERFLRRDERGIILETLEGMCHRVSAALVAAEKPNAREQWQRVFFAIMRNFEFHPGSRTMANAGTLRPQLANCFVFPLEDSQDSILKTFTHSSMIKGHGGGCGFNYSKIRPRGDAVRGIPGLAVGPVKLMELMDSATSMFRQQGRYESGNMAVLGADHPDILDFIRSKTTDGKLPYTNVSVAVANAFMEAVRDDAGWELRHPSTRRTVEALPARQLFHEICRYARDTGDPGLIFTDHMNANNPLRGDMGDIVTTNPCGEIGLYPYESCNLGYLNLTRLLLPAEQRTSTAIFDEVRLRRNVAIGIRMIDNAITVSWFPLPEIHEMIQANRRIGLGVTGWADCLAEAGIAYDSEEALIVAERLSRCMYDAAFTASLALGRERGPFPNIHRSIWKDAADQPRNVALLSFPPSGNNAVIFDTSFAIEPYFALVYTENVMNGVRIKKVNQRLMADLARAGVSQVGLVDEIESNQGSIQSIARIPQDIKLRYRTAHDIAPQWHVRMQAAFQKHVDNAITKTVNLAADATVEDVKNIFMEAWRLRCKGITVYRDVSRADQQMMLGSRTQAPASTDLVEGAAAAGCAVCSA
jgi:ribonucleoside-diphosphate reductase alpha chain